MAAWLQPAPSTQVSAVQVWPSSHSPGQNMHAEVAVQSPGQLMPVSPRPEHRLHTPSPQKPQSTGQSRNDSPLPQMQSPQVGAQSSGHLVGPPSSASHTWLPHACFWQSAAQADGFSPLSHLPLPHAVPQSAAQVAALSPHS
jgi:hypothetical protein